MIEKEYECPNCKKPLVYDENLDSYFCPDCGEYFSALDFEEEEVNQYSGKYSELDCKICGKVTIIRNDYSYGVCPFCYNNLVDIKDGVQNFKPNFIIKFKDDMDGFKSKLFEKAKEEQVPDSIMANLGMESIKGVYLPFHIYTVENKVEAFMQTTDKDQRYSDDFYRMGVSYIEHVDAKIDVTGLLNSRQIEEFANYNMKKLDMFFPDRLLDFFVLEPSLDKDQAWKELSNVVLDFTTNEMKSFVDKNDVMKDVKVFNKLKNISRKTVLMPVWIVETVIDEEIHYLYVNGQTYKMTSDIEFPRQVKKSLFKKPTIEKYQVSVLEREDIRKKVYKTTLEFMNEIRKRSVNQNDRTANIRKIR